jgi:glycopeptide antibiotics resistance protein
VFLVFIPIYVFEIFWRESSDLCHHINNNVTRIPLGLSLLLIYKTYSLIVNNKVYLHWRESSDSCHHINNNVNRIPLGLSLLLIYKTYRIKVNNKVYFLVRDLSE